MRWRRRRQLPVWTLIFILVIMLLVSAFVYFQRSVVPVMSAIARKKTEILATEVINQAMMDTLDRELKYSNLITIEKDSSGRVVFMQPDLVAVNRIKLNALKDIQRMLGGLRDMAFSIPLGQLVGGQLFATYGPHLNVAVIPVGTVDIAVREEFQAAAINQTRHILYLLTRARMQVVVPLHRETIEVTNEVPLVESIIVGDVPESYFELRWNQ